MKCTVDHNQVSERRCSREGHLQACRGVRQLNAAHRVLGCFEALGLLCRLIESSHLLHDPLHLLSGEWLAGACCGDRITIDKAVSRVWQ